MRSQKYNFFLIYARKNSNFLTFSIKNTQNMAFNRTLITAALPYANGPVHIGHLAGVYVPADIYARYLRLKGKEVLFVCGSDEHGVPVTIRARKEGITTQQVVDRYHALIKRSFEDFGVSFDIYSRTTSDIHHRFAADYFRKMYDAGQFVEETSEQFYDPQTGHFLTDRNIRGECPRCHSLGAYGDQCEKCGATLSPDELINPYNAETGNALAKKETKHWYLPLDKYQAWLEDWILNNHKEWRSNVYGQCKSWLDSGLKPRAVTRDLEWGIPVPVEGAEGKVLYVWFDAPIGYISNTIELCEKEPAKYGDWQKWWKQEDTRMIHFIGKDNIVFHCIVFPSMLKAQGYNLPDNVPSNEFLNLEGDKISTSRNWAVWLNEYLDDFPGKQDVLRYVLTANAPETKDNDFTWADFQARNNNELVAIYGNFVNRALVLTNKYFEGKVPACGELTDYDQEVISQITNYKSQIESLLDAFRFRDAQKEAMNLARIGNKYLADTEPWKLAKQIQTSDEIAKRVQTILHLSLQIAANLAIAFEPFLPFSSEKLRTMLQLDQTFGWEDLGRIDMLREGQALGEVSLLFEKIEDAAIQGQLDRLERIKKENEEAAKAEALKNWRPEPIKEATTIDEFDKNDIRVATVLECTNVKKSDRLLQFKLDDGMGGRTILSGIAQSYPDPSVLVGKQVLFIANFPPRKMMGIESQGMILSAVDADGKLVVTTVSAPVKNGVKVG